MMTGRDSCLCASIRMFPLPLSRSISHLSIRSVLFYTRCWFLLRFLRIFHKNSIDRSLSRLPVDLSVCRNHSFPLRLRLTHHIHGIEDPTTPALPCLPLSIHPFDFMTLKTSISSSLVYNLIFTISRGLIMVVSRSLINIQRSHPLLCNC